MIWRTIISSLSVWIAGLAPFTERGQTDFDTFLQILNPYGAWQKLEENRWAYYPFSPEKYIPFTQGQWVYSDFGWYFLSNNPISWATEHYGTWKLDAQNRWAWFPDEHWHPDPIEWRTTKTHFGWRPTPLNKLGDYVESEEERYARAEEWIFLPKEKITQPFTMKDVVTGTNAQPFLDESEPISHIFMSYREIERPGPDPQKVLPKKANSEATPLETPTPIPVPIEGLPEPVIMPPPPQFDYYTLKSLPTFHTPIPPDAKPFEIYAYRPKIFQDRDGIMRRITVWHAPQIKEENRQKVKDILQFSPNTIHKTNAPTTPSPAPKK